MEQKNFGYSLKDIPTPGRDAYRKCFIEKLESFIHKTRWKALFSEFENKEDASKYYGFKTLVTPPAVPLLRPFEDDLYALIKRIEFRDRNNHFQQQLARDVREIRASPDVLVSADKTFNLYSMPRENYKKLLHENTTKSYKVGGDVAIQVIDQEAKHIAARLGISERVETIAYKKAFITLKDHKPGFWANPACRLINPAKSEIGIVSKKIVDGINSKITYLFNIYYKLRAPLLIN